MKKKDRFMIKIAAASVAVMVFILPTIAQTYNNWLRPSGQNYIYNVNTGNVGIGTTAPIALFQMVSEGSAGSPGSYPMSNRLEVCSWAGDGPSTDNGISLLAVNAGRINTYDGNAGNAYLIRAAADNGPVFVVKANGRVGIGLGSQIPSNTLDIHGGKMVIESNNGSFGQFQILNTSDDEVSMVFASNVTGGQGGSVTTTSSIYSWGIGAGCYSQGRDLFGITSASVGGYALAIQSNGNVGIGTITPSSRLAVNGTIRAKEVIVTTQGWPDHVFKPDYNLKPLDEVEKFIKKNSHLEGIPSEKEVMKNGVSMGDMQTKLLQKLEETTLYLIELKKENLELKSRLAAVEQKVQ